jgi:hypothetical protein
MVFRSFIETNRKLTNCVMFSYVTCEMEFNVECDSTSTGGTFRPWLWQVLLKFLHCVVPWICRLQVCPRVSYYLPYYMGHICGLQCYHHLGRICAVLTLKDKAIDNFPAEQDSWKSDIHSSIQEIESFNGKWTYISELKSAYPWGPLWHCTLFFNARLSAIHAIGAKVTVAEAANFYFI